MIEGMRLGETYLCIWRATSLFELADSAFSFASASASRFMYAFPLSVTEPRMHSVARLAFDFVPLVLM